jgi:hypothetical protein
MKKHELRKEIEQRDVQLGLLKWKCDNLEARYSEIVKKIDTNSKTVNHGPIVSLLFQDVPKLKCPACQQVPGQQQNGSVTVAVCGHIFCRKCLRNWIKDNKKCPECDKLIVNEGFL